MALVTTTPNPGNVPNQPGLYEQVVDSILKDPRYKGISKDQIDEYMSRVKWHESGNQNINQIGGGPASGFYQIEKNSMPYAYQGLNKALGYKAPWYDDIKLADENTQAAYSLGHDLAQANGDKKAIDFSKPMDAWLTYHWRGKDNQRQAHIDSWNNRMKAYSGHVANTAKVDINPVQAGGLLPKPLMASNSSPKATPSTGLVKAPNTGLIKAIYAGFSDMSDFIDQGLSAMAPHD